MAAKDINDNQARENITAVGSLSSLDPALKYFKYWVEFQGRSGDNTSRFSQEIVHLGIGYIVNNTTSFWHRSCLSAHCRVIFKNHIQLAKNLAAIIAER